MSPRMILAVAVLAVAVVAVVVAVAVVGGLVLRDDAPTKDEPAEYTKALVDETIDRYERDGRQATIDYYNSTESVDGAWYVFIVGPDGVAISHHNPTFRGRDPSERVDTTGYFYGDDLLGATEEGRWVDYVLLNPGTAQDRQKHTWAVRHDGLLFASGWYEE